MIEAVIAFVGAHPYPLLAVVLVGLGIGLPLPEEVVLLAAGYLCHEGRADPAIIIAVAIPAIVAGDAIPFAVGRRFGERALALRPLRSVVTPARRARLTAWFARWGDGTILLGRFVPGLRFAAVLLGGTLRMRWRRFLTLDLLAVCVATPCFVLLGRAAGDAIDAVFTTVRDIEHAVLGLALVGALGGLIYARWRPAAAVPSIAARAGSERLACAVAAEEPPSSQADPDAIRDRYAPCRRPSR